MNFGYGGPFRPGYPGSSGGHGAPKQSLEKMTTSWKVIAISLSITTGLISAVILFFLFRIIFGSFLGLIVALTGAVFGFGETFGGFTNWKRW